MFLAQKLRFRLVVSIKFAVKLFFNYLLKRSRFYNYSQALIINDLRLLNMASGNSFCKLLTKP